MSGTLLQAAGLCVAAAILAASPASRGIGAVLAIGLGALGALAAGGWLLTGPALPVVTGCAAGLGIVACLLGQGRLLGAREDLPGGWRGRFALAAGPLLCATGLGTLAAWPDGEAGVSLPGPLPGPLSACVPGLAAGASAALVLAALTMVAHRARGTGRLSLRARPVNLLQARFNGIRLAFVAGLGLALAELGTLVILTDAAPHGDGPVALPGVAGALLLAGMALAAAAFPLQGLALAWLEGVPQWLVGGITAATSVPAMLVLLAVHAASPPHGAVAGLLLACGVAGLLVAGLLGWSGRAAPRDAVWLALGALALTGIGTGTHGALAGAVLATGVQVLVGCLPPLLARFEAVALLAGCYMPFALVAGGLGWWELAALLPGVAGLASGALGAPGAAAGAPRDPWRWPVLALLLAGALVLPGPLGAAIGGVAGMGMTAGAPP